MIMLNSDAGLFQDMLVRLPYGLVASIVAFQLVVRPNEWVGPWSTDLGQVVRFFLCTAGYGADQWTEEGDRGGNDCRTDFGGEPDKRKGRSISKVGVAGNEGNGGSFVYSDHTSTVHIKRQPSAIKITVISRWQENNQGPAQASTLTRYPDSLTQ